MKPCPSCGLMAPADAQFCSRCGYSFSMMPPTQVPPASLQFNTNTEVGSKKIAAGLCGLLLGSLGIHKFILGYTGAGIIMLLASVLTCGIAAPIMHVIGIIEGILYLTKSDQQFYNDYVLGRKEWF
jgi:TM2 domain-containing membrane protein YozV